MENLERICITGAGGFIGGWLVRRLLNDGCDVRAIDVKPLNQWKQLHSEADNRVLDLRLEHDCRHAVENCSEVYNLAADMGGIGFITGNKARCMLSVLITTHVLKAAAECGVSRLFYSSSACIYPAERQDKPNVTALRECDAYPAMAEDGYGWEKLFGEQMCRHFTSDFGIETRIGRLHNVYGPHGDYKGGREKAPAALCRKIAIAKIRKESELEVWGDGKQTRSFMWIDNCVNGIKSLMTSDVPDPINIGSAELVTIDELARLIEDIADVELEHKYKLDAPRGVAGRNSDNTLFREFFDWEPDTPLSEGLRPTYEWIENQVIKDEIRGSNK